MRPLKHVFGSAFRVFKFILIYLLSILLFLFVFSLIYAHFNVVKPYPFSFDVIWGNPVVPEKLHKIAISQNILYDIFLVFLVGTFISQQLRPSNPIEYSKYIVYNQEKNCYFLRYWLILPKNKYLYDATVRLVITTQQELNRGINQMSAQFEKQDTYISIRGVRYLKIEGADAFAFSRVINKEQDCVISLYILGTTESGITYSAVKRYGSIDIKNGYEFVSIRKSEYEKQIRTATPTKKRNLKRGQTKNKEIFRYQNFDRIYVISGGANRSKNEPIKGNVTNVAKERVLDFASWVISLFLD